MAKLKVGLLTTDSKKIATKEESLLKQGTREFFQKF